MLDDATRSPNPDVCPFFRRRGRRRPVRAARQPGRGERVRRDRRAEAPVRAPAGARLPQGRARRLPPLPPRRACLSRAAATAAPDRGPAGDARGPARPRAERRASRSGSSSSAAASSCRVVAASPELDRGRRRRVVRPRRPRASRRRPPRASRRPQSASSSPSAAPDARRPAPRRRRRHRPHRRPTPKPTPKPTKKPTSDRYKLLKACPNTADCWIYTVRSGDNLSSIANYFGRSLRTIYALNPKYPGTALRVGAQIRMPPPTR